MGQTTEVDGVTLRKRGLGPWVGVIGGHEVVFALDPTMYWYGAWKVDGQRFATGSHFTLTRVMAEVRETLGVTA